MGSTTIATVRTQMEEALAVLVSAEMAARRVTTGTIPQVSFLTARQD